MDPTQPPYPNSPAGSTDAPQDFSVSVAPPNPAQDAATPPSSFAAPVSYAAGYGQAPQPWLQPARLPTEPAQAAGHPALFDLRPLTMGEVLDRTFSVYRSRFWLFCGIASIGAAFQTLLSGGQMIFQNRFIRAAAAPVFPGLSPTAIVSAVVLLLFVWLAYSITQAATVYAVSEVYLGRTTTIAESLRLTAGRWFTYVAIGVWQACSIVWIPFALMVPAFTLIALKITAGAIMGGLLMLLLIPAFVVGIILGLRNFLAVPATVAERLKLRATMRRSKVLAAGIKGRIFVVLLISWCLYMVVGVLQSPLAFVMVFAQVKGHRPIAAEIGMLIINFIGHSVVTPVAMIGLTLLYFDQRVRKEAFDIAVLLGEEQPTAYASPEASLAAAPLPAAESALRDQTSNDVPL